MSANNKPPVWLLIPVLATSFWVTFGVLVASAPVAAMAGASRARAAAAAATPAQHEVRDPALERMISRFADAARRGR